MREDDEPIKEPELKDEEWSEPDDESLLIEEDDLDSFVEKSEEEDFELPDFLMIMLFHHFVGKMHLK
ncbi:RNA polymerase sigma factor RpoS [Legionella sainthelensi]|nr:RNA polymerase sigma factor RpoS [Legionella sainthelensi]